MHPYTESTMARAQRLIADGLAKLDEASNHWRKDEASTRLRNEAIGAARWCFEAAQQAMTAASELEREAEAAE
jgi:hypothetical protein